MSAIVGVLRLDGGVAEVLAVRAMLDAMPHRAAASVRGDWSNGSLAFGWLARGPDAALEWPRESPDRRTALICDARLDTRTTYGAARGPSRSRDTDRTPDPDLLLDALSIDDDGSRLGALPRVIGEFALAAWQPHDRRLILARDALALRSLYWARQGPYLWWASELQAMLAVPWATARPNESFIGEALANFPVDLRATVFEGIERIPPAHALIASPGGVTLEPYWHPPAFEDSGRTDREYADRMFAALKEAVRCRLHDDPRDIGFQLSGGLDSSSVVALAREEWPKDVPLRAYSLVYPGLAAADERHFIAAMTTHAGVTSSAIDPRGSTRDVYLAHVTRYRDLPDVAHGEPLLGPLCGLARADGVRVLLTGAGADHWLGGNFFTLAMLARRGRWLRVAREIRAARPDTPWSQLIAATVLPNVPMRLKRAVRPFLDPRKHPAWITPAFARRIGLADRLRAGALWAEGPTPVVRESVTRFWSGELASSADRVARAAAFHQIDLRHPFLDRRVVEIVMTLPDEQRAVEGLIKIVLRRAMGERLPRLIRERRDKGDTTDLIPAAIETLDPDALLRDARVVQAGWVDGEVARALLRRMRDGQVRRVPDYDAMNALWRICGVESWLRHEQSLAGGAV